jgi:hypothetical protein
MNTRSSGQIVIAAVLIFSTGASILFATNTPSIELRIRRYATNEIGERLYAVVELVNRTDFSVSYIPDREALRETLTGSLDPDLLSTDVNSGFLYPRTGGYTGPAPQIAAKTTLTFRYYNLGGNEARVVFRTYDLPIRVRMAQKLPSFIRNNLPAKCLLPREQVFTLKV